MKKIALFTAFAGLLATAGAATEKPATAGKKPAAKKIECPIMKGNKVDVAEATAKKMYADYKGNRYYFCCAGCEPEFKKNPAKYAKAPHLPVPKKK